MMQDMIDVGGSSKSAYMLLYERRLKTCIPELTNEEGVQKDATILSEMEYQSKPSSHATQGVYKDLHTNELYLLHDFHHVPQIVPEEIKEVSVG